MLFVVVHHAWTMIVFKWRYCKNPFFITSDNLFEKKGLNSLHLRCKSQTLMRFVKLISFNSCGIRISSFLTSPRRCIWRSIVEFHYGFDVVIINFIWLTWTLLIFEWEIPRTEFMKPITTLCLLRLSHHTHHVTFQQPVLRSFLHKNRKEKYVGNARFYTPS